MMFIMMGMMMMDMTMMMMTLVRLGIPLPMIFSKATKKKIIFHNESYFQLKQSYQKKSTYFEQGNGKTE